MGYICQFDDNRKYWTIRQRDWKRPIRLVRMGEQYTNEAIRERLRSNSPEVRKTAPVHRKVITKKRVRLRKKTKRKIGGLRGLYCHYCYLLGYYPKRQAKFYRVSLLLRDDLLKLNYISQEAKLLQKYQIDTMEQLLIFEESISERINQLKGEQKNLIPESRKVISSEIREKAQQLVLCRNIAKRSPHMKEKLGQIEKERNCRDKEQRSRD